MPPTNGRKELVAASVFLVRIPGWSSATSSSATASPPRSRCASTPRAATTSSSTSSGRLTYPKLELKRGLTTEDNLIKWFMQTRVKADRKEVIIDILNRYGEVHRSYVRRGLPRQVGGPSIVVGGGGSPPSPSIAHAGLKMA